METIHKAISEATSIPLRGLPPSSQKPKPRCEICGKDFESRGKWAAECPQCTEAREISRELGIREAWRVGCGVPPYFQGKTFKNFERERQPVACDAVEIMAEEFLVAGTCRSLLLYSIGYGTGKTHLVSAMMGQLIERWPTNKGCPGSLVTEIGMMTEIRATYASESRSTEEAALRALAEDGLLIIDDVGKYQARDKSFTQRIYFEVVNGRYVRGKPVVITSNSALAQLGEHIGGAAADRLIEMCQGNIIELKGSSYRAEIVRRQDGNVQAKT